MTYVLLLICVKDTLNNLDVKTFHIFIIKLMDQEVLYDKEPLLKVHNGP